VTTAVVLGSGAVLVAALLGGATGFGAGLVCVPLLLLIGFPLAEVVAANLTIGLFTRVAVAYRLREHIDRRRATLLILGSVPGIVLGRAVGQLIGASVLKVAAGLVAMAFAGYLFGRPPVAAAAGSRFGGLVAGASGGFLATTISFNGVPPVLWLSRTDAAPLAFVADLAVYFVAGNLMAVPLLLIGGSVPVHRLGGLLLVWLPVSLVGNALGLRLAGRLSRRVFRAVTLGLVIVAGAATVATAW
jgi:uncharacterized membrane protein YfcA